MVVMKIKLKRDSCGLHAEIIEGLNGISQNNAGNNVVRVMLDGFELAEGEVLRIAYATTENENDPQTLNVAFSLMSWIPETNDYESLVDSIVLSTRGEWLLDLQIASEWNEAANDYSMKLHLNEKLEFAVNNSLYDATGAYPNIGDISALYDEAVYKIKREQLNTEHIASLQQDKVSKSGDTMTDTLTIIERESSTPTANPGLIIRNKEAAGIDLIAFSSDGTIQRIKNGVALGMQVLPDKAGTLATLDDVTEMGEEKVSKTGDEMTGPLRVSSSRGLEKAQLQNNGVEVGVLEAEEPNKTWYANGFILRTKEGKDVYIALPDKDGTLITADDIAAVREAAEDALSIAKGANQSLSYGDYATLIATLNALPNTALNVGQNLYIFTVGVPDLWVAERTEEAVEYTYTTDEDFVSALKENDYVQVGFYKLGQLETQEAAITDCVKFTDYATTDKAGVVKNAGEAYGIRIGANGNISLSHATNAEILNKTVGKAIMVCDVDYAVKVGITTNTETLTDDTTDEDGNVVEGEKTKACKWLGAIKKLPSATVPFVYLQLENGTIVRNIVSNLNYHPQAAVFRLQAAGETTIEPAGTTVASTPVGDWDCTPKKYVDDTFVSRLTISHNLPMVYAQKSDGTETAYQLLQNITQGSSGIPLYFNEFINGTGYYHQVAVGLVPTKEYSATSKKYVDENKGTKLYCHNISTNHDDLILKVFTTTSTPYTKDNISTIGTDYLFARVGDYSVVALYADSGSSGSLTYGYTSTAGFTREVYIDFYDYSITDTVTEV